MWRFMAAPRPEMLFDRYLPLKQFVGGMGVVHLCADMAEGRAVALKTFRPELLADGAAREQFLREASVWVQIGQHPHVVAAHLVRLVGDRVYVVCELVAPPEGVAGAALRAWLGSALPPAQALDFALGIARGMGWAASRVPGLVHRDLKPENVLVGRDRRARVTDFGLALVRGQADRAVCGTPRYMAPEQWSGHADVRADIYALGLILLEMTTGATGIPRADLAEVAAAHQSGAAARFAAGAPAALRPLIEGMVALDPARRPASWEQVEQALLTTWSQIVPVSPPVVPQAQAASREQRVRDGWSHHALASALGDLGHLNDAIKGFQAVIGMARDLSDEALEAAALGNLGHTLVASSDLDGALAALEASLAIKRRLGDRLGEANSLTNRGNAQVRKGQPALGLADHEEAARIFAELGRPREQTRAMFNMLPVLAQLGRSADALALAGRCREAFRSQGDARGEGAVLGTMGQLQRRAGALEEALASSDAALRCFRSTADGVAEARELSFQGHTLRALGRMPKALECFEQSLKLAQQAGDMLLVGSACYALAQMTPPLPQFKNLGRHHAESAAEAYRKAGRDDLATDADALAAKFGA
jgi:tetratricopeptide (TPR) repeat protein